MFHLLRGFYKTVTADNVSALKLIPGEQDVSPAP